MKNSFFVFLETVIVLLFYFLIATGSFIWFAIDAFGEDITVTVILTIMLLILPIGILLWAICTMAVRIKVDEKGITKTLFGIKMKFYKWEELKYFHVKGNFNQWIFLSKKDLSKKSLSGSRLSRDTVYFFNTDKKMAILRQYIPKNLIAP